MRPLSSHALIAGLAQEIDEGRVPARVFIDPEIYELEQERIFATSWLYVGHVTEIPEPGDYVTRNLGSDSVILARDNSGTLRCLLNSCRHRGTQICRAERGRRSHFICPYHGWTYSNTGELIMVTAQAEAYGDGLDKSQWGLVPVAQVDTYCGMIFATWNPDAPPLAEYLGGITWYLDLIMRRTDGGMKIVGPPHRFQVGANWKLGSDNFIGDGYHIPTTHGFARRVGLAPRVRDMEDVGAQPGHGWTHAHISVGNGHGLQIAGAAPSTPHPPYIGLPEELWPEVRRNLSTEQANILEHATTIHGTVFPNFSFLNVIDLPSATKGRAANYTTLRLWQPKGPDRMEVWSWFLVEKSAPTWFQEAAYETYVVKFGAGGTFEQDDMEIWSRITGASRGWKARQNRFNYLMGLGDGEPVSDWPGPGEAYARSYSEANQRAFLRHWQELMSEPSA